MFRAPAFSISLLAVMFVLFLNGGPDMLFTQYLQTVLGLSPTQAGMLLIIPAILALVGTLVAPVLTRLMRPAFAMAAGLIVAVGGAALIMLTANDASAGILIIGVSLISLGGGPAMTIGSELLVSSVSVERAGSASAMQDVGTGLGNALGIAFLGSIGMLIYRRGLADSIPQGVSPEETNAAMESIGAAIAVAEQYPAEKRAELLEAMQASFTFGIQVVYAIAALGMIMLAIMVVWKLRHLRNDAADSSDSENQTDQAVGTDDQNDAKDKVYST